jgi:membrane protease YdiL (CAAX protease family)
MEALRKFFFAVGNSAWVIFGLIGASIVVSFALEALPKSWQAGTLNLMLINASVYILALLIVIMPLLRSSVRGQAREILGIARRLLLGSVGKAVLAFVVYFGLTIIVAAVISAIPGYDADQSQDVGYRDMTTVLQYVAAFVGLVVLPPVAEELLFRGYLFGQLRRKYGFVLSALVTSAMFGLVHLQWNVGIDVFTLSLVLCYLRENTGSIWAGMIVHGMKNGLAYFVLFIEPVLHLQLIQ